MEELLEFKILFYSMSLGTGILMTIGLFANIKGKKTVMAICMSLAGLCFLGLLMLVPLKLDKAWDKATQPINNIEPGEYFIWLPEHGVLTLSQRPEVLKMKIYSLNPQEFEFEQIDKFPTLDVEGSGDNQEIAISAKSPENIIPEPLDDEPPWIPIY